MLDNDTSKGIEHYESRQRFKFYMAICRARQEVYLLYERDWPKPLQTIHRYIRWISHE